MTQRNTGYPSLFAAVLALLLLAGCAEMSSGPAVDYAAIIAAPDRSAADRATDVRRKAVQLLAFTGARPGMKVLDLATGGGYSTELMARAVGPTGVVGIAVHAGVYDAGDSSIDDALGTWRRASLGGAGFQGDIEGGTAHGFGTVGFNGIRKRLAFGVRATGGVVPAAA